MLDKDILQQVKTVFASLKARISFLLTDNGNHSSQAELTEFLNDLVGCSEQLSLHTRSEADAPFGFSVLREGEPTGIHFRGIPNGHEFTSLLLAVLNADGQGKNLPDAALSRRIAALKTPLDLRTYVSLTCTNCPDVVQALNVMALINPGIRHEMVDGGLFQDEVDALKLQGVPAVFLGDEQIHIGRGDLGMLLDKLEEKAGSHELPEAEAVEHHFDVVVVGGGPAGTSAAVYSARKGLNVAIVAERIGGQVNETQGIENLISVPQTTGRQLSADLLSHLEAYPIAVFANRSISSVSLKGKEKRITAKGVKPSSHRRSSSLPVPNGVGSIWSTKTPTSATASTSASTATVPSTRVARWRSSAAATRVWRRPSTSPASAPTSPCLSLPTPSVPTTC